MNGRNIVIHAHFYQPPRENAWLEAIEIQDGAYPYHDWNQRINAECYAANAFSRILGNEARIDRIVSNYKKISFNFGPTLLSWMKELAPHVHDAIVEADRQSLEERSGHGNAIAQCYNHLIMPLASRREKETQVVWGIEDFKSRFGRPPEGMWLPETAVDTESLEVLAANGIKFTILAPSQAHRVRRVGARDWTHVDQDSLDIRKPYLVRLPSRRSITVFFYNGPVSRAIAFENLLSSGENFAGRLVGIFGTEDRPQIAHIATDGESYGHHSKFGDMALSYCIHYVEEKKLANVTNYGEYLAEHPPEWEAEIQENTSWSCFHGVERWRANCGCNTGAHPDWNQEWRKPLRESMDWLNAELAGTFETMGGDYFRDPWGARNGYIQVILDRGPESVENFFSLHAVKKLNPAETVKALKLLEMQRHSMLMFTSCGWFFDDLSGIETVQVVQYAGRAIQLHEELAGDSLQERYLERLSMAKSNLPGQGTGREIYDRYVKGKMVDLKKVAVHYAISSLFEEYKEEEALYCYDVEKKDYERYSVASNELAAGRVKVRSRIIREENEEDFAVIKIGSSDINCGLCLCKTKGDFEEMKGNLRENFLKGYFSETLRLMDKYLGTHTYSLKDLFTDEQRKILNLAVKESYEDFDRLYKELFERNRFLMGLLKDFGAPIPDSFLYAAEHVLAMELKRAIEEDPFNADRAKGIYQEITRWGVKLDPLKMEFIIRKRFHVLFNALAENPVVDSIKNIRALLRFAFTLPFQINLWEAQNTWYGMAQGIYKEFAKRRDEGANTWIKEFMELGKALFFNTEEVLRAEK